MTGLKLTGFKEMDLVLRQLPYATAKRVADRAIKQALAPVAAAANGLLPKGMPPVIVEKRLNKNQAKQFRGTEGETGTGFGLPLAAEIIQIHRGSIQVESPLYEGENSGTAFHITLPRVI